MSHRRHFASKMVAVAASVVMLVTGFAVTGSANAASESNENLTLNRKGVIVTAFQQNWKSIAEECRTTYGPEGVKYVQVSPPNEHVKGEQWWTSYQPVSYKLKSKLGDEDGFKKMIQTCKAAKVGIIADAVINHMTGAGNKDTVGVGGSEYDAAAQTFKTAGYTKDDFHQSAENIKNYKNAEEVWTHRLVGLLDLDTSKPHVRETLGKYFAHLLELGVAGFRIDAVKHISPTDMAAIKAEAAKQSGKKADDIWWMQETIGDPSEAPEIQPKRHLDEGDVNEFQYSYRLKNDFYGSISNLKNITDGLVQSDKASIFVTNWDTPRENYVRTLTYKDGPRYELANAFMLGYPYGNPNIYSGYRFENGHKDDGAPKATETSVPDVDCSPKTGWQCTQRWTSIRGMVGFFNAVNGAKVTNWQESDNNNIAFSREKKGFLAINNTPNAKKVLYKTDLPNGEYCNVYETGNCSKTVKVENGKVAATVAPYSAIALHVDAKADAASKTGPARDESDPKYNVDDVKDQSTTVYFNAKNRSPKPSSVNIHYQISGDNWTAVPGLPMRKVCGEWFAKTIVNRGGFKAVFNDGRNNWYNNNNQPKVNFEIPANAKNYVVNENLSGSSNVSDLPCKAESSKPSALKTKIVIHYKQQSNDNRNMGVYMWGLKDADGKEIKPAWHAFNGQDAFGKTYTVEAYGTYESGKVGFIITEKPVEGQDWKKDGGNRYISQIEGGVGEAWVYGGDSNTFAEPPAEVADKLNNLKTLNVTVHYRRTNKDYAGWNLWTWYSDKSGVKQDFTAHDDFGKIAEYTFHDDSGVKDPKFIVRYSMKGKDWVAKDPGEGDRAIPAKAITLSQNGETGNAEIWLMQGDSRVYLSPNVINTKSNAINADITSLNEFTVNVSGDPSEVKKENVTVTDVTDSKKDQHKAVEISQVAVVDNKIVITAKNELDIKKMYEININGVGGMPKTVSASTVKGSKVVRTDEFDQKYAYIGDDLGAVVNGNSTTFKLWAPTATKVELVTYKSTDEKAQEDKTQDLTLGTEAGKLGVWSITTSDAKVGTAYTYKVHFADGAVNNSPDPYAKAAVRNGMRSVVFGKDTGKPVTRMESFGKRPTDATIAEMNIRDFSIHKSSGVGEKNRGKYLGVIEPGTTHNGKPTGLDYLKSLGITHVQIMPMYDFGSVNEAGNLGYVDKNDKNNPHQNWGYDPINYNVPEGSYASDSANPATRITELKQMVDGLHKAGLRVIMDVVYNHVYNAEKNAFGQTVPGYYFRYNDDGSLSNRSGCGNDTASERKMMCKYIVDSVKYWAKEYGIDGFRFDLMGLIDLETIKEVREAVHAIDPSSIILGEGWDMSQLPYGNRTIQPNAYKLADNNGVAFFNDSFRDAVKGHGDDGVAGFVSGNRGSDNLVMQNLYGCQPGNSSCTGRQYDNAGQTVQYVEAHDNLNLYDKLKKSLPHESDQNIKKRVMLANSLVMFAHGMPFFELGQEFLRSKNSNANSYNAGDGDNSVKWDLVNKNSDAVEYFKALIKLRNEIPALRDSTYSEVNKNMHWIKSSEGINAFSVDSNNKTYVFIFNANSDESTVNIGKGKYRVRIADGKSNGNDESNWPEASVDDNGNYKVSALSTAVLVKDAEKKDENSIDLEKVAEYKLHPADVSELVNGSVSPAPEPSPAPGPHPEPQPGPQPKPGPVTPTPQPPAPSPVPTPQPQPHPTPNPPAPAPKPGPVVPPTPQPAPAPGPVTPSPAPRPQPVPQPGSDSTPGDSGSGSQPGSQQPSVETHNPQQGNTQSENPRQVNPKPSVKNKPESAPANKTQEHVNSEDTAKSENNGKTGKSESAETHENVGKPNNSTNTGKDANAENTEKPAQVENHTQKAETAAPVAPAAPAPSVPAPEAPATVKQLKLELKGTLTVGSNDVATAGVVNNVSIHVVNSDFTERLKKDGVVYAYAYIYSTPRLLKSANGSKYVTVRMVNGVPQFDAMFPAGYSGKHTVVLVDEQGKQLAWTEITVVNNAVNQHAHELSATGSSVAQIAFIIAILLSVAGAFSIKVRRSKHLSRNY
ncbi:type I pullulanase [Gardnerella sp. Marseille-Q2328]|uniref:type I pullulanase n=1 Tax=Gardnerella sp. Marseille-Q2328 TaxID=2759694 RepID=UPI0020249134|nr:type I pullulanase [Gardnerella sp. Marseille-Q2328]